MHLVEKILRGRDFVLDFKYQILYILGRMSRCSRHTICSLFNVAA